MGEKDVKQTKPPEEAVVLTEFEARPTQATLDAWAGAIEEVRQKREHLEDAKAQEEAS